MSIALALRDSLLETDKKWNVVYGIPTIIYIDNGRDYRSRHIEEVCLHFGIEQRFHEGYRPQSKGKVERFFGTLETMCISTLDGYVGSNVQKRPHKVKPKLSMGKLQERIDIFLSEYHERRHGTTKRPPRDLWLENMTTPRPITDRRDLDYLLKVDNRIVQKQGISFKYSYWLDKENVLKGYIGQKVSIFYDPRDLTQISVWAMVNGEKQYICTAFDQGPKDTRREAGEVRAKNAPAKKDVRKRVRDYQKKGAVALQALEQMESVQTDKQEGENELSQEEPANQPSTQEAKSEEIPAQPEPKEPVPISAKQQKTQSAKTGRSVNDQEEEEEEYDWETMRRRLQRSKRER
jgi:putative transposase